MKQEERVKIYSLVESFSMENPQANIVSSSKGHIRRMGCVFSILISPFILFGLYFGYCWGWWGRHSLLLQYFFQCQCPAASEQARYPSEVEVLISACQNGGVRLSPSGRFLAIHDRYDENSSTTYLLDFQTSKKTAFTLPYSSFYFLNDDLLYVFVFYIGDEYILDRTTNTKYPIRSFIYLQPEAYSYGEVDTNLLFQAVSGASEVFITDHEFPPVIILSKDFRTHPEHSFTFDYPAIPKDTDTLLEQFLQQNNIPYYHHPATFPGEAVSPNGKFIARNDGIYLQRTGEKIVEGYGIQGIFDKRIFSVRGWKYDSSGVIYSKFLNPCVIEPPGIDDHGCIWQVPQPVIVLKVPKEYLAAPQTP